MKCPMGSGNSPLGGNQITTQKKIRHVHYSGMPVGRQDMDVKIITGLLNQIDGEIPEPAEYEEFTGLYEAAKRRNPQANHRFWAWEMFMLGSVCGKRAEGAEVAPVQQGVDGGTYKKAILEMMDGIADRKKLRRIYIIVRTIWEDS